VSAEPVLRPQWLDGLWRAVGWTESRPEVVAATAAAVAIGLGAALSPRLALEGVLGLVLFILIVRSLLLGVVVFVFVTFPSNLPHTAGLGATLAKPVGLAIVVSWVFGLVATRGRGRLRSLLSDEPLVAHAAIAFGVWTFVSMVWAYDSHVARNEASRMLQVILLLFIVFTAVRTERDLRLVAWSFVTASGATAAYALASGATAAGRLTGGIGNANMVAAEFVAAIALAVFMLALPLTRLKRLALVAILILDAVAFVRTGSRGGIVALGCAFLVAMVVGGSLRPRIISGGLVLGAAIFAYYTAFAPAQLRDHVTSASPQASASRTDLWKIAFRMTHDHPLFGVGIGNFRLLEFRYLSETINLLNVQEELRYGLVAHNSYFEILAELGVVGLALFLLLCFAIGGVGVASLRATPEPLVFLTRGLVAATAGLLVAYFFDSGEYEKQLWILFAMVAASSIAARKSATVQSSTADPLPRIGTL
jgi:O-antigen ligase